MTVSKCSNGNPGCLRGFVREKCHKCQMGSTACNMCHSNLSSLMAQHQHAQPLHSAGISSSSTQHNRISSTSSTSSSSSTSSCSTSSVSPSPESSPRNSLFDTCPPNSTPRVAPPLVKTLSISYQLPLPSGHPQRSLVSNSPTIPSPSRDFSIAVSTLPIQLHPATAFASSSFSQPSSPISPTSPTHALPPSSTSPTSSSFSNSINNNPSPYAQYGPSSPCIFCFNGRKACEECFGLGYVQRICQDCLRNKHRSQRRRNSHSAHSAGTSSSSSSSTSKSLISPAVSASWVQFSHKLKEQFSFGHHQHHNQQQQQQQLLPQEAARQDGQGEDTTENEGKNNSNNINKQRRKEKRQQRSKSMISLPLVRTLSLTRAASTTSVHRTHVSSPSSPILGPVHEEALLEEESVDPESVNTLPANTSSQGSGEGVPVSPRAKKSFKAVLSALKVPSLFQANNSENSTGRGRGGSGCTSTDASASTGARKRQSHRRQWSLPSLASISLPVASTAA